MFETYLVSKSSSGELSPSNVAYPRSFFSFLSFRRPKSNSSFLPTFSCSVSLTAFEHKKRRNQCLDIHIENYQIDWYIVIITYNHHHLSYGQPIQMQTVPEIPFQHLDLDCRNPFFWLVFGSRSVFFAQYQSTNVNTTQKEWKNLLPQ